MLPPGKPLKVCSSEPALRPPEQPRVCRPRAPTPRRLGEGLSTAVARGPPWLGSATSRRALPRRGLNGGAASTCRKGDGHRHSPVGSQRGSVPSPRPPQESYRREPQSRTCSPAEGHHVRLGLGGVGPGGADWSSAGGGRRGRRRQRPGCRPRHKRRGGQTALEAGGRKPPAPAGRPGADRPGPSSHVTAPHLPHLPL